MMAFPTQVAVDHNQSALMTSFQSKAISQHSVTIVIPSHYYNHTIIFGGSGSLNSRQDSHEILETMMNALTNHIIVQFIPIDWKALTMLHITMHLMRIQTVL